MASGAGGIGKAAIRPTVVRTAVEQSTTPDRRADLSHFSSAACSSVMRYRRGSWRSGPECTFSAGGVFDRLGAKPPTEENAMLAGEAVIATWNGIAPEGRAEFYDWHIKEHIPERVGIPGFRRGRRYVALTPETHPEFFTLYETDTMQVLQGMDYANRLNAPTPWTRSATAHFRDTARALARVLVSEGPGMGGVLLTVRFDSEPSRIPALSTLIRRTSERPCVCGAHLGMADDAASQVRTVEAKGRTDIQAPPTWFMMVEATDAEALSQVLPEQALLTRAPVHRSTEGSIGLSMCAQKPHSQADPTGRFTGAGGSAEFL